jgi:hypothetical protein
MELLAGEPMVASPVAMAYDENGRAYVCEMGKQLSKLQPQFRAVGARFESDLRSGMRHLSFAPQFPTQ